MMKPTHATQPYTYRIRIKETVDRNFADWMDDMLFLPQENGETLLVSCFADQAALRGFLDQLWNLNITVITVERIDHEY